MDQPLFTTTQRRAALAALDLDPDLVVSITLTPGWAHLVRAVTEDGTPVVIDGALVTEEAAGPVSHVDEPEPDLEEGS